MLAERYFKGHFNLGNVAFEETAEIQCVCMALLAILYPAIKEASRWDQHDLDIVLVNENTLYATLGRRILLTAEDLPRNIRLGEETVFPQFRESKYGNF